ncbi:hypothetical protein ACJX0J_037040, partial [Zea mays]
KRERSEDTDGEDIGYNEQDLADRRMIQRGLQILGAHLMWHDNMDIDDSSTSLQNITHNITHVDISKIHASDTSTMGFINRTRSQEKEGYGNMISANDSGMIHAIDATVSSSQGPVIRNDNQQEEVDQQMKCGMKVHKRKMEGGEQSNLMQRAADIWEYRMAKLLLVVVICNLSYFLTVEALKNIPLHAQLIILNWIAIKLIIHALLDLDV